MKARSIAMTAVTAASAIGFVSTAALAVDGETIVYQNDFENVAAISGWSSLAHTVSPSGRGFLGEFGAQDVVLNLENLVAHDTIKVDFDVYLIRTWDGVTSGDMDRFRMMVDDAVLLDSTFAVSRLSNTTRIQNYPDPLGGGTHLHRTGAIENNTLGFTWNAIPVDAVWRFSFTIPHSAPTATLTFSGIGLQDVSDESWGLDNVRVAVVPAPASIVLSGIGIFLIARRTRR